MKRQPLHNGQGSQAYVPTTRATSKRQTYGRLIEAARRSFAEHGYEATTLREVAHAAGVSTGAVFAHFADKAALFIDVINLECEKIDAEIEPRRVRDWVAVHNPMALKMVEGPAERGSLRLFKSRPCATTG